VESQTHWWLLLYCNIWIHIKCNSIVWKQIAKHKLTQQDALLEDFITMFTLALHWSLSWARSIESIQPSPISLRSILISSSYACVGLPSGLFPSGFPIKNNTFISFLPHAFQVFWFNFFKHALLNVFFISTGTYYFSKPCKSFSGSKTACFYYMGWNIKCTPILSFSSSNFISHEMIYHIQ
jgi:hypothetical protein